MLTTLASFMWAKPLIVSSTGIQLLFSLWTESRTQLKQISSGEITVCIEKSEVHRTGKSIFVHENQFTQDEARSTKNHSHNYPSPSDTCTILKSDDTWRLNMMFPLFVISDMREQTMLTEHPTTTEYVPYSKQITSSSKLSTPSVPSSSSLSPSSEKILLNVTTTDTVTISEHQDRSSTPRQQHEAAALLQSTPATDSPSTTAAELPRPTGTVAQTSMDQYKTNYSIKFTTFRPCKIDGCQSESASERPPATNSGDLLLQY